ncbi:MAG: hypothetical protein ACRD8A_06785 [Candidatus Acidiferrales bacterium]
MHTASPRFWFVSTAFLTAAVLVAISLPGLMDAKTVCRVAQAASNNRNSTRYGNDKKLNSSANGDRNKAAALPIGRVIYAELAQTIDVRRAKRGEPIAAKVTLGVLSHGKVLVAEGAKITGHVTEVKIQSEDNSESVLGIVFDRADTTDGKELPLNLTVQAIGIGQLRSSSDAKLQAETPYSAVSGLSMGAATRGDSRSQRDDLPPAETKPALDIGSKGMVGLKGLKLIEGVDAAKGSLVTSVSKNVKLDSRWQLVLRVIAPKAPGGKAVTKN